MTSDRRKRGCATGALIRALIDWIVDHGCTPHVAIDCGASGVQVPLDRAVDGKLVLNVSASATRNLDLGDDTLSVDCRFGGRPVHVSVPVGAVLAVYARETGMGMAFEVQSGGGEPPPSKSRPKLTLVK